MTKQYRHPCSHVRRVWEDTDMQVAEFLLNRDLCKGLIMMRLICWEHDSVDKARKGLDPVSWGLSYYDVWIQLGSGYLPSLHTRRDLVGVYNPSAKTRIRRLRAVPGWRRRLFWHADGCSQCLFHSRRGGRDGGFDGRSRWRTQVGK